MLVLIFYSKQSAEEHVSELQLQAANVEVSEADAKYFLLQSLIKKTLYKVDTWLMM